MAVASDWRSLQALRLKGRNAHRNFGEIAFNIFGERWRVAGSPKIVVISNITEDGRPVGIRRWRELTQ